MDAAALYRQCRGPLFGIAYRMSSDPARDEEV
jgi:hypothetical protein